MDIRLRKAGCPVVIGLIPGIWASFRWQSKTKAFVLD
jgi:CO dehydrogenase/acetyl-CoA synthase alpha subunit